MASLLAGPLGASTLPYLLAGPLGASALPLKQALDIAAFTPTTR